MGDEFPRVFGGYLLLAELGAGGMGQVFFAQRWPRRPVPVPLVVKRLRPDRLGQEEAEQRFQREAELALAVQHPYVARVLEAGWVAHEPYMTMEYVPGLRLSVCLDALVSSRRHLSLDQLPAAIEGLLGGLDAVHETRDAAGNALQIVHRDICPRNLIMTPDGELKLIDLGIGWSRFNTYQTATGMVLGTPGYMSPEQVRGRTFDRRSDLYSLAVVLFEIITLSRYLAARSTEALLREAARPTYRPLSSLRPNIPPELDRVFERALAVSPSDRFATAAELGAAIREAIGPAAARSEDFRAIVAEGFDVAALVTLADGPHELEAVPESTAATVVARHPEWEAIESTLTPLPRTSPTATPAPTELRASPRLNLLLLVAAVSSTIALVVGVGIGLALREPNAPIVLAPSPASTPAPVIAIGVSASSSTTPPQALERVDPIEDDGRPPRLPSRPRRSPPTPSPAVRAAPIDLEDLVRRTVLLRRSGPSTRVELDELQSDLAAERAATLNVERRRMLLERVEAMERLAH